jgi:hypothetical protein
MLPRIKHRKNVTGMANNKQVIAKGQKFKKEHR